MEEYLKNRLNKLIAPKTVMEVLYSVPYTGDNSQILYESDIEKELKEVVNFDFSKN